MKKKYLNDMGIRDFSPFGTKAIEVKFNCNRNNCNHEIISEEIEVPSPDYSAENHSDSIRENEGYAVCSNCGAEYEIGIQVGFGGGNIIIDGIADDYIIDIIEHSEEYDTSEQSSTEKQKETIKPFYTGFKLKSLEVDSWYILEKFKISFEDRINILIGENGSGKSSVIECLALIFGDLHKFFNENDRKASYIKGYNISFTSQNAQTGEWHTMQIENLKNNDFFNPSIYIDDECIDIKENELLIRNLLPTKIGLYYAGVTDRLQQLSFHFEEKYNKLIKETKTATLYPLTLPATRPFLYVKKEHIGIMLMCLMISEDTEIVKCWKDEIGIDLSTSTIELALKKPSWANDSVDHLWGAHDLARQIVLALSENTESIKSTDYELNITHNGQYLKDEFIRMFKSDIESKVFDIFDFLLFSDLLDGINITWKNKKGEFIELDRLSEGEKHLITTMGFRMLWMNQKGFLLFDEPDTFLHPNWQVRFINDLTDQAQRSQYIIATHSPQLINNNFKGGLFIIKKGILIEHTKNFYGRDINSILTHYMNAQNRPADICNKIDKIASEIAKRNYQTAKTELDQLKKFVSENDAEFIRLSTKLKFLME